VVQEDDIDAQLFDMDGYFGSVVFDEGHIPHVPKDWRHFTPPPDEQTQGATGPTWPWSGDTASRNEFYLVGASYRLFLRPKLAPGKRLDATLSQTIGKVN